ncbi:MAG: serine/threonine protein kinase, partial [Acidobacteria bacterium]|nr:serine/threonine protein kinase [Acidobacteriota bacterium]
KIPHRRDPMAEKSLQECVLQSRLLDHPNIVKLLTVDIIDHNVVMVMEFIKGTDLETLLDKEDKLELPVALKYFKQLLSALDYAHKHKVIHRDIRPSNIMINEEDDIKITDFGTSTLLDQKQYATTRIGSPPYMAPEQFEGRAVLASDIYSAGCLFYEMTSGLPPIVLANPMEIYKKAKASDFTPLKKKVTAISDELDHIITRAMAPDLEIRYKNAADVLDDLEQMGKEKRWSDNSREIKKIKERIDARHKRTDYICWNCNKVMPRQMDRCLYCGTAQ